ncbi:WD repeat-containing protein 6-like isoform X1 [Zingiber officinale]|uniref:WD repeat-containing protein 6-like isoform X1 n=1 Tax=Zingiber officinale TaxID=94328 RepID=UPI001C4DAB66|nr:WD repeat-containing protein 6-like isoform X1 [Zingiber officinale]
MAGGERSSWRLRIGPYFGEVSALSFVPLPRPMSPFPLLLAGTGSELLVYDVRSANLVETFQVFEGVRVHGISLQSPDNNDDPFCSAAFFIIAIYGERRVKLFRLCVRLGLNDGAGSNLGVRLELIQRLPGFDHWVLDACFLKEDNVLAVGLSDNSVALWNLTSSIVVTRVKSSERCLLYSMRLWGNSIRLLIMASGTIFNEIIIWKLIHEGPHPSSNQLKEHVGSNSSSAMDAHIDSVNYVAYHLNKLIGHEGSIFRMSWSSDGTRLMSVSDDRSARIWLIDCQKQKFDNLVQTLGNYVSSDLTLFGHNARIWDCYISHSVAITAGEDCSCRVWATSGDQLLMLKEHIGRGIWRCLYDPDSSLLVSAGFDSAVKVHQITSSSSKEAREQYGISDNLMDQRENFQICIPKLANQLSLMDSKSEYVRCIQFTQENSLYIATNNGYLYHVELSNPGRITRTELIQLRESQIICMDILPMKTSESSLNLDDIVAIGDGNGKVTVVGVNNRGVTPSASFSFNWSAEKERQLLGVHWCRSLGSSYLFTSDPQGILRMWKIEKAALESDIHVTSIDYNALLLAVFTSSFRHRIMCIDASRKEEVLICGDKRGNIILFPLVDELMVEKRTEIIVISPGDQFKGAHGISSVTSICIVSSQLNDADIQTTGADGCICYFQYSKILRKIEFIGMNQVKDLSMIQSVFSSATSGDTKFNKYAIGFTSVDFITWDMTNETKTIKIPCGGWRRPFSFHFGDIPEHQNCFAYVKDHIVHVHRVWVVAKEKLFPKVLHMQYHGREIHSLSFISAVHLSTRNKGGHSWIATGCEDGSLRLARYSSIKAGRWSESILLGEHVGGSAVRSLCFIPKIYTFKIPMSSTSNKDTHRTSNDSSEDQLLLISVGSKQVLTSWILQSSRAQNKNSDYTSDPSKTELSSISFRWFSTQLPSKFASRQKGLEKLFKTSEESNHLTTECDQISTLNSTFVDQMDNDWRYLAVTAFLLKPVDSRTTICFIVVACSDATLMLKALLLPYRLWFDVALLVPVKSPVLSLQHVVPWDSCSKDAAPIGNAYLLISGSTDGSITFWDLTEVVESFVQTVLDVQPQMFIDCQRRPKTGRGSQGGRRWKSLSNASPGNTFSNSNGIKQGADMVCSENEFANLSTMDSDQIHTPSSTRLIDVPKGPSNIFSNLCEIHPSCVLSSLHQSGVNCLNVAEIKKCQYSKSEITYCVLSGGDDQSLHLLVFGLQVEPTNQDAGDNQSTARQNYIDDGDHNRRDGKRYKLNVLSQNSILSAHNSAVKGVWTDGTWAFTTGLDQRIRCWQIDPLFRLSEHSNVIISVPEPETLDAIIHDSGGNSWYQIAVAGRGMQMVEFKSIAGDDE